MNHCPLSAAVPLPVLLIVTVAGHSRAGAKVPATVLVAVTAAFCTTNGVGLVAPATPGSSV